MANRNMAGALALAALIGASGAAVAEDELDQGVLDALDDPNFRAAIESQSPLTPEQLEAARYLLDEREQAEVGALDPAPGEHRVTLLEAGERTDIRLTDGYDTTIRLTDRDGNVLPIVAERVGNRDLVDLEAVRPDGEDAPAVALIAGALQGYGATNITLFPKGEDRPVTVAVRLRPGHSGETYDDQHEMRLTWVGEQERPYQSALSSGTMELLMGTPGEDYERVSVGGSAADAMDVQAWRNMDGEVYVRVPEDASVAWRSATARDRSAGVRLYALEDHGRGVPVTQNGEQFTLVLQTGHDN